MTGANRKKENTNHNINDDDHVNLFSNDTTEKGKVRSIEKNSLNDEESSINLNVEDIM